MKRSIFLYLLFAFGNTGNTQQNSRYHSVAVFTTQNALPFHKAAGLFKETVHPGVEIALGKTVSAKANHEWYVEMKAAYFYHRFVQHGLPVYLNAGYRSKIRTRIALAVSLGAGYMHAVPATSQLKLDRNGIYKNGKGIGRLQAIAAMGAGMQYCLNHTANKPVYAFINYQQMLQFPFVKSYVPLLPYTSFIMGIRKTIKNKKS